MYTQNQINAMTADQAETKKAAEEVKDEVQKLEDEGSNWADKFRQRHGISVWVALIGGGFIVWQVGATIARALGVA